MSPQPSLLAMHAHVLRGVAQLYLDGIVTVVDSKNVARHLDEVKVDGACNEAQMQVAFADFILLNKQVRSPHVGCRVHNVCGVFGGSLTPATHIGLPSRVAMGRTW